MKEGDQVTAGTILASLGSSQQLVAMAKAQAAVTLAEANLAALLIGTRVEGKAVTSTNVARAAAAVARARETTALAASNNVSLLRELSPTNQKFFLWTDQPPTSIAPLANRSLPCLPPLTTITAGVL